MSKTYAIIQARMGSQRLPGKTLADIAGQPSLALVVDRVMRARTLDGVVVATGEMAENDPVAALAATKGAIVFRGHDTDVLDRYLRAAQHVGADLCVRITADCPFVDPALIDEAVRLFRSGNYDYVSNVMQRSYPDGMDVEVFSRAALERAHRECSDARMREHVTPYLKTGHYSHLPSGDFRIGHLRQAADFSHLRWTLDSAEDLEFFRAVLPLMPETFGWQDVVAGLTAHPELLCWNRQTKKRTGALQDRDGEKRHVVEGSVKGLERALKTVPLGSQTFSKSYQGWVVGVSPLIAERGKGARVYDVDGNGYIDYVMGLMPIILGYSDPHVDAAIVRQLERGITFSMATALEAELAEKLAQLIPCAEMTRFGKNGSDATTGAIRLARAYTGRDMIAVAGYHGWHDWYIGSTEKHIGVPDAVRGLTVTFGFNDAASLDEVISRHGDRLAAIILEPTGKVAPLPGYLQTVRAAADRCGALLVFDEIITGFRVALGGAQAHYGVTPDLACFGKAIANGMPLSALVGKREFMQLLSKVFVSSTFGGEALSLAAALATIEKLERDTVVPRLWALGERLKTALNGTIAQRGMSNMLGFDGDGWWPRLAMGDMPVDQKLFSGLLRQELNRRGVYLASSLNLSLAHDAQDIERETVAAFGDALDAVRTAIDDPDPAGHLGGSLTSAGFSVRR